MENLKYDDIAEVKSVAQRLLNGKFFCAYNSLDERTYQRIVNANFFTALSEAMDAVGYDLRHDEKNGTIYIKRQEDLSGARYNINIFTTKVTYVLLREFMAGLRKLESGKTVFYRWNDLLEGAKAFVRTPGEKNELIDAIWFLKDKGIVNINALKSQMKNKDEDGNIAVEIYPSILCLCNLRELKEVEEKLSTLVYNQTDASDIEEDCE